MYDAPPPITHKPEDRDEISRIVGLVCAAAFLIASNAAAQTWTPLVNQPPFGAAVWTNQGAIYDPVADPWTRVNPPAGWKTIGDAQGIVLANGTFMLSNCCTKETALFDAKRLTWTPTGAGKATLNDEEGWTLLRLP